MDIQVIVNEEAEENEEYEKYEDKCLQKKKRKGKKVEFVENEMDEDEMVESDKAEEPPIRKKKLNDPSFVDVRKLKGDMLVLKGVETVLKMTQFPITLALVPSVTPPKSGSSGMVTMGCYVKVQQSRYRKRP
ncbi:hypothetical protein Tco_0522668 [Tanacetum coccineum]